MRSHPRRDHGVVLAIAAVLVTACSPGPITSSGAAPVLGSVAFRITGDWNTLDPGFAGTQGGQIASGFYDRLLAVDSSGKIIPYLAKSWKVSPGSVTFELRTDATCSDGTPVTAEVVANSFKRMFAPASKNTTKTRFGTGPFIVTADDPQHVTINVSSSLTSLLYPFTSWQTGIICPAGLASGADLETRSYGSGPYTLESAVHGDAAVLKVRPDWKWGPSGRTSSGLPQQIVFKVVGNETTAANLLTTGGLDIAYIFGADVNRLQADKALTLLSAYGTVGGEELIFNHEPGRPGAELAVRQALATSIDRKSWSQAANAGRAKISTGFLNEGARCYDPTSAEATAALMPQPSLDKAKGILLSAGYVIGSDGKFAKGGKPLAIKITGSEELLAGPEYLLEQFSKLGVTATLSKLPRLTWFDGFNKGDYDVTVYAMQNPTPDPLQVIDFVLGPSLPEGQSRGRYRNPVAEQAVREARTAASEAEMCKAFNNMQREVLRNVHFLPLDFPENFWFTRGITFEPRLQQLELYTIRAAAK